jgi:hypothetical protein
MMKLQSFFLNKLCYALAIKSSTIIDRVMYESHCPGA